MSGIFWADTDNGLFVFVLLGVLGAAAAASAGRALAKTWSPAWLLIPYMAVLSAAVHFLHFALFQEDLIYGGPNDLFGPLRYYLVTLIILMIVGWLSYKSMRATQMATQYSWSYEKSGINWRPR
jgi:uncharacterized membrane protein YeaQ/YmgE (transglycosylase-associated protein family)